MANRKRDAPCPCGSGRAFDRCHGAAAEPDASMVPSLVELADRLSQTGRHEEALRELSRAAKLAPNEAAVLQRLGQAHERTGRLEEAISSYQGAFDAAPDTAVGGFCKAHALRLQNRSSEAEEQVRHLIARDPSYGDAHLLLGSLLTEGGRFDEAAVAYEQAVASAPPTELTPWAAIAYRRLVTSRRLTQADRPLVSRIESLLDAHVAEPNDVKRDNARTALHFAAGKALDDLGDYAAAIQHFDAAHAILRGGSAFDCNGLEQAVGRAITRYTPEFFALYRSLGRDDETPLLVLGMPRSGTTLVERIVSSHRAVAGGGELPFWNRYGPMCTDAPTDKLTQAADRIRAEYLRVLHDIGPAALRVTDKTPFNFFWIGLVHLFFPRARIIHCRRHPIDTCLSIYSTNFAGNWQFANDRRELAFYYRQYVRLMDHWRAVLPPERFLEVDYEQVTEAPEVAARRLVAFCGLEWDRACAQPERNPGAVQTASVWQSRQPVYRSSVERWRNYEPWLGELGGLLAEARDLDAIRKARRASNVDHVG